MSKTKSYEFRTLSATDIFPMCNIISKIGIKEFKNCFQGEEISKLISDSEGEDKGTDVISAIGVAVFVDIAGIVLANLGKCENEIFTFLASVSNMEIKTVQELPLSEFAEMVADFFGKKELKDFMKVVSKFLK